MFAGGALKCEGTIVVCQAGEDEGHVLIAGGGWGQPPMSVLHNSGRPRYVREVEEVDEYVHKPPQPQPFLTGFPLSDTTEWSI